MSLTIMLLWTVAKFTPDVKGTEWVPVRVRGREILLVPRATCHVQARACLSTRAHLTVVFLTFSVLAQGEGGYFASMANPLHFSIYLPHFLEQLDGCLFSGPSTSQPAGSSGKLQILF